MIRDALASPYVRLVSDHGPDAAGGMGAELLRLEWLGQAGFVIHDRALGGALVIDPYLSDYLAVKYEGRLFPHLRMTPIPLEPGHLTGVFMILCTHAHSDHMDPWTLPPMMAANPTARVVVPLRSVERMVAMGIDARVVVGTDAGERRRLAPSVELISLPSAHEELDIDATGASAFLGYVVEIRGVRLYHSGDCAPYEGLAETLTQLAPDVALLPVNGRDQYRRENGVPGNFTWREAVDLCATAGIPWLVPMHFGMFDFNTIDPGSIDVEWARTRGVSVVLPAVGRAIVVESRTCA